MDLSDDVLQQTTTAIPTAGASSLDIITAASKDPCTNNNIVKGKRTKRQRPPTINNATHNSSTSYNNAFNSSSPATSSEFPASSTTTQDEDTAKCLILLSKGTRHQVLVSPTNCNNISDEFPGYKFNSKRYIQTSSTEGLTTTGIYVYECKTCSRTFPSFQALGGHRASHKKPRIINEFDKRKPYNTAFSDEDEFPSRKNNISPSNSSSLSLQLNHRSVSYNPAASNTKKSSSTSKLHECSICGAEFNSGQALGGHMRRHRAANGNVNTTTTTTSAAVTVTNTTLSLIPYSPTMADDEDNNIQKSRNHNDGLYLDLDLNLPAPSETATGQDQQHRESSSLKFTANQNKQQPVVHLSATPTLLVDCHN